ncbi:OsmC family protein [Terricaulis silvestris]|uniref:OsmC-like protein n=1 Tax=Terricaulis silvestris TaxID=2686094 RepID=A0A6I6MLX3_9CAUL|nr:OsmC family protein [Terricaulis silvestris]QGZ93717.1 OsmC-like protein [Terricaulis silvestris]
MKTIITSADAEIREGHYPVAIKTGRHELTADESVVNGGQDAGPEPFALLLSALAACTVVTLKMYAERKQWPLAGVRAHLRYLKGGDGDEIRRTVVVEGPLNEPQRARLAEIAEKTPVTLVLKQGLAINTQLKLSAEAASGQAAS